MKYGTVNIPDFTIDIDPPASANPTQSGSRAYFQKTTSVGQLSNYLNDITTENTVCTVNRCTLLQNCDDSIELTQSNPYHHAWFSSSNLSDVQKGNINFINLYTDVEQEQTLSLCLKCLRADNEVLFRSNTFKITWKCPNNMEPFEPTGHSSNQVNEICEDSSFQPRYNFSSFLTKTKSCPVEYYEVIIMT